MLMTIRWRKSIYHNLCVFICLAGVICEDSVALFDKIIYILLSILLRINYNKSTSETTGGQLPIWQDTHLRDELISNFQAYAAGV